MATPANSYDNIVVSLSGGWPANNFSFEERHSLQNTTSSSVSAAETTSNSGTHTSANGSLLLTKSQSAFSSTSTLSVGRLLHSGFTAQEYSAAGRYAGDAVDTFSSLICHQPSQTWDCGRNKSASRSVSEASNQSDSSPFVDKCPTSFHTGFCGLQPVMEESDTSDDGD
eukprot:Filipodium_phascolosomae@DN1110_c0_g1_i2.p1